MSDIHVPYPACILIPREAYRYWPAPDIVFRDNGKKSVRFIFEHQILSPFERDKLNRLLAEIEKSRRKGVKLPENWSENHLLRYCYGGRWKTDKSLKGFLAHLDWIKNNIPGGYKTLYPKVLSLLVPST